MTQQTFVRLVLLSISTVLLSGSLPQSQTGIQQEIDALTKRGFTVRWLDNDLVELTDPLSGEKRLKSLSGPTEAEIRDWATARGIPILEIDPNSIDTSEYAGWFEYWGRLPISNGFGRPLVIGDADRNGNAEVYGARRTGPESFQSEIHQVDSAGIPLFLHAYPPGPGVSRSLCDTDSDVLTELAFTQGGILKSFEQTISNGLPTSLNFEHYKWEGNLDPGFTGVWIGLLDADSLSDFLYKGSECDSVDTTNCITKVYVAEYNQLENNFIRVWSTDFDLNGNVAGVGGFAVDDFDGDGRMEFAVAEQPTRRALVVENSGDNSYTWTWQDSVPFPNLYFTASGDVDNDGKPEFFVGATTNGSWTTMYEADSNDHYSAKRIIHLLSGGLFDQPTYLTTDVNGDGVLELVIMSGNVLYILKSREDNTYYLWYLKREDRKDAVAFYDFNHDGWKDFIISKYGVDSLGRPMHYADYYRATALVSVEESSGLPSNMSLHQNYPNPFNPSTRIHYELPRGQAITMKVYTILGQEVETLFDGWENPGAHMAVWDAGGVSSGVYLCRLSSHSQVLTIKLLLIR